MNKNILSEISRMKEIMGLLNENIESVLEGGKVLKRGNRGPDVEKLQKILIEMGYDLGEFGPNKDGVDGIFGGTMDKIVREFQDKQGLKVDGKVGKNTLTKMLSVGQSLIPDFSNFLNAVGIAPSIIKPMINKLFNGDDSDKDHFVFYFAFPGYEPKFDEVNKGWFENALDYVRDELGDLSSFLGEKGTYGAMGHAGVALINSSGNVVIFEFGRYGGAEKGMGVVESVNIGKVAKIEGGKVTNLDSVCSAIKNNAQGQAKKYEMDGVLLPITKEGYSNGLSHAKSKDTKPYSVWDISVGKNDEDANCATYGLEVVKATGAVNDTWCAPAPIAIINRLKLSGTQTTNC